MAEHQEAYLDGVRGWVGSADDLTDPRRAWTVSRWSGWWLPRELGGGGLPLEQGIAVTEELATLDAGLAFSAGVNELAGTIVRSAPEPLRSEVLAGAREGWLATAASEHDAGSELQRLTTAYVRTPDGLRLNGRKAFVTNGAQAKHVVVLARHRESSREVSAIVVPTATPGLRVTKTWNTFGMSSAQTVEMELEDVVVPERQVIPGNGLRLLETGLNVSRTHMAAIAVGIARRLLDDLLAYGTSRQIAGRPLTDHPVFAARTAELHVALTGMRWAALEAARAVDRAAVRRPGRAVGVLPEVIVAKLLCGRLVWEQAAALSSVMGGLGYVQPSPVERALRDARLISIVEGGEDVLRELLHHRVVGRARRPDALGGGRDV